MNIVMQYLSEIVSFVAGAAGGAAVTLKFTRSSVKNGGVITDQSKARAEGDIVGRDKITRNK
ncbi:hypothetical protein ACIPZF_23300 [Pseudomonas sp. NPDC089752]|uniref:hypothetical protein n=1 Tax=Pseudomonas sp. NPDC089752 TaxID=3364472 RepID=UPI00382CC484